MRSSSRMVKDWSSLTKPTAALALVSSVPVERVSRLRWGKRSGGLRRRGGWGGIRGGRGRGAGARRGRGTGRHWGEGTGRAMGGGDELRGGGVWGGGGGDGRDAGGGGGGGGGGAQGGEGVYDELVQLEPGKLVEVLLEVGAARLRARPDGPRLVPES